MLNKFNFETVQNNDFDNCYSLVCAIVQKVINRTSFWQWYFVDVIWHKIFIELQRFWLRIYHFASHSSKCFNIQNNPQYIWNLQQTGIYICQEVQTMAVGKWILALKWDTVQLQSVFVEQRKRQLLRWLQPVVLGVFCVFSLNHVESVCMARIWAKVRVTLMHNLSVNENTAS